jgi:hypothetical protein
LVTFRVSAEEHDALTKSCMETGARSIADFARAAVLQKVQTSSVPVGNLAGDLTTLTKELRDLDLTLNEMRKRIRAVLGHSNYGLNAGHEEAVVAKYND